MRRRGTGWTLLAACFAALGAYAAGTVLTVQVENAWLRSKPNIFTGRKTATLRYGERVTVLEDQEAWLRVEAEAPDKIGWISASAVTDRKIALAAGEREKAARADEEELTLAGRGFNKDVEGAYRRTHRLDYAWVDRMETDPAFRVSHEEMLGFLRQGGLPKENDGEGGER